MESTLMYFGLAVGGMLAVPVLIDRMKNNLVTLATLPFVASLAYLAVVYQEDILYEMGHLPKP